MKTSYIKPFHLLFVFLSAMTVSSCRTEKPEPPAEPTQAVAEVTASTDRVLPTIYPTNTAVPAATPTATRLPQPTAEPDTPVAFDQVAVDIRYYIPGLALDRRIKGTVANQIEVIDQTTGDSVVRRNQPGVLLELQQALSEVELSEVPDGCDYCVQMDYELPLAGQSESGWLEEARLLASLENYTSVLLGPHFPEGTILGLRRSASPFHAAHTVGLTGDGQLYFWTAIDPEVTAPQPASQVLPDLTGELASIDSGSLAEAYTAPCPGELGRELLYIRGEDGEKEISVICPELSLPTGLTPIYQVLGELAAEALGDDLLERPATPLPLDSLVYYRRADDFQLRLSADETAVAINTDGLTFTGTVTSTVMVSMTTSLIESNGLTLGVSTLEEGSENNILFLRGEEGVYEAHWAVSVPAEDLVSFVDWLDDVIARIAEDVELSEPEETRTPAVEPTSTP